MISLRGNDFEEIDIEAGGVLFKAGSSCKYSYIVKYGNVVCFSLSSDKRVIPISSVGDGGLIGEDDVFKSRPVHSYNAVALVPTHLVKLPNKDVMTYLNSAGDWMKCILFDLSEKVTNTNDILVEHKIIDDRTTGGSALSLENEKLLLKAIL